MGNWMATMRAEMSNCGNQQEYERIEQRADLIEEQARARVRRGVYRVDPVTGEIIGPGGPCDSPGDLAIQEGDERDCLPKYRQEIS